MTVTEARGIITDYYMAESHTEDDKFLFVEAYHFLIDAFHRPYDMHNLAFHYAEERHFDLYQKYLELSTECVREGRSTVIKFNNKWYRDINSFFEKAKIGGRPLTALYGDLIDYEIEAA